jgi:hypothetical protein
MGGDRDPRSEAEKARAALKRNAELGSAPAMSPLERQPSVTPDTFGEHGAKARALSGSDQGVEAGGPPPAAGAGGASQSIAEADQVAAGRDETNPVANRGDADALSRKT